MSENTDLTFYDVTGQIVMQYSGQNPEGQKAFLSTLSWVEGIFLRDDYYILDGVPTLRPAHNITVDKTTILADGVDAVTFSGCPADSDFTAINTNTRTSITGTISGTDTFTCTEAGTIRVTITNFPYLPYEVLLYAN